MSRMSIGLGISLGPPSVAGGPSIQLSGSSVAENASVGTVIGALSVTNHPSGSSGWTFAITTQTPSGKLAISGANLQTAAALDYETNSSLSATITASKSGQSNVVGTLSVAVTNVLEVTLGTVALSALTFSTSAASSGTITGKTSGSTLSLSGSLPTGLTLDLNALTWAWAGGGSATTGSFSILETHPDGINSPKSNTQNYTISDVSAASLWTPANASAGAIKGWWDISDYANRSVTSGAIDSVNDKSGNGLTLFGGAGDASGTKPTFSIGGFAQESASFDGSHNVLCSSGTLSQAQPFTLYQSFYPFLVGGANQTAFDGGNSILWRPTQGGNPLVFAGSIDLTRPSLSGQPQVVRLRYSGGNGSLGINGGADSTKTAGANGISAGAIRLGDSPSNGAPFRGLIRETVLINGDVTAGSDLDQRMVGYLAWAGGSWSFLDNGHAYRYAAPKVGITAAKANIPWASSAWIPHGASGDYHATNICDFNVVDHPSDPTKLVLYATGQAEPPSTGTCSIGRWIIDKTNPTASPTFDQVVLVAGGADAGGGGVRLGSVLKVGSTYYMYYCSQSGTNSIFLATSTDSVNFTKAGAAIIVPSGDEENIGEPTIWWEGSVATIIYTYRTASEVLPGYRFATSSSLTGSFTKGALPDGTKDILRRAVSANNNALQLEAHQIVKRNGRYYLFCEMGGNDSDATPYRIYLASCDTISGRYKWEKLVIAENPAASASSGGVGGGPKYHVATPCLFTANGTDYLIYEGAPDQATPYAGNRWNGYISAVTSDLFDLA